MTFNSNLFQFIIVMRCLISLTTADEMVIAASTSLTFAYFDVQFRCCIPLLFVTVAYVPATSQAARRVSNIISQLKALYAALHMYLRWKNTSQAYALLDGLESALRQFS